MALNNYPVNRSTFRLIRGVQNEVQFLVKDVDRKPVGPAYFVKATIYISDPETDDLLLTRDLTIIDVNKGRYLLTILAGETANWPTGSLRYSIAVTRSDGSTVMLWTDMNYSPYSSLELSEGPSPTVAPTADIPWADFSLLTDGNYYTSPLAGAAQDGFTNGMQTFTCAMTGFSGTVVVQASLASQPDSSANSSDWFQVSSNAYTLSTGTNVINAQGSYVWMRLMVTVTAGSLTDVQYKN